MRLRLGVPRGIGAAEKQSVLDAALESVTRANEALIARGVPTFKQAMHKVRWKPEPPGDEHFDLATTVLNRKWGDCDDLAPWHAASLRVTGVDPEARAIVVPSSSGVPGRWHAIVERGNGSIDDPSIAAGMGRVSGDHYRGPFWNPMSEDSLALATYPLRWPGAGFAARVDVPSATFPASYSGLATGNSRAAALVGALGPLGEVCGSDVDDDDLARICGVHDLLLGVPPNEVAEALEAVYGDEIGFGPALALAAPFAGDVVKKAAGALGLGKGGGGGGGGAAPGGGGNGRGGGGRGIIDNWHGAPIIVRF